MGSERRRRMSASIVLLVVMSSLTAMSGVAMAVPLPIGTYNMTSGALMDGSFTIGDVGGVNKFTEWDFTFPATTDTLQITFMSPTPTPDDNSNNGVAQQISFRTGGFDYTVTVGQITTPTYTWVIGRTGGDNIASGGGFVTAAVPIPSTFGFFATSLISFMAYQWLQRRREGTQVS